MTKEELIEFACELTGGNITDLSPDQMQQLTAVMQRLSAFGSEEFKSFGQLCALRADVDEALTHGMNDPVMLRFSREQCTFLLALIDRAIREHA